MSNHIIESITNKGIKTTPWEIRQFAGPKPGDPVLFPEDAPYPFQSSLNTKRNGKTYGRIASVNGDEIAICCGGASVFLYESGAVSISGGPFTGVTKDELEWSGGFLNVRFWNWGDNSAGAHQGVDYSISRPVWALNLTGGEV